MKDLLVKISLLFIGMLAFSCEEAFFENDAPNNPEENFEVLWELMKQRYSLFEFKNIDWDSTYAVYRPMVSERTSDAALFDIMAAMLNTLEDGHTNLWSPFDISRHFPYLESAPNFSFDVMERNYLGVDHRKTGFLANQIIDSVGYVYYSSFQAPIADWELDTVINRFNGLPGVIIDIRDNEGGNPANGLKMARRMIRTRTHIYTSQQKSGPGPNEFGEPQPIYIDPQSGRPHFQGTIVVLTNRKVYSAGSYFSASMRAVDRAILLGDTTGGGSGVPAGHELPNGWHFNYSSTIGTLPDGFNFEDGVPPDIYQEMTAQDIADGVDPLIERAIQLIKSN